MRIHAHTPCTTHVLQLPGNTARRLACCVKPCSIHPGHSRQNSGGEPHRVHCTMHHHDMPACVCRKCIRSIAGDCVTCCCKSSILAGDIANARPHKAAGGMSQQSQMISTQWGGWLFLHTPTDTWTRYVFLQHECTACTASYAAPLLLGVPRWSLHLLPEAVSRQRRAERVGTAPAGSSRCAQHSTAQHT